MARVRQALTQAWNGQGGWGQALALALLPMSWGFGALVACRRWLYHIGLFKQHVLPVPVIVVGNVLHGLQAAHAADATLALRAQG